jgi:hypothetical protein
MYESSLRHPVWVPEINVNPCNSVVVRHKSVTVAEKKIFYRLLVRQVNSEFNNEYLVYWTKDILSEISGNFVRFPL